MPKYIALFQQAGEGCDYMIGCGQAWRRFEADSFAAAEQMIKESLYSDDPEITPSLAPAEFGCIELFEIGVGHELPLDDWEEEHDRAQERETQESETEAELRELARLQAKYLGKVEEPEEPRPISTVTMAPTIYPAYVSEWFPSKDGEK